jgi:hypothetical protein
MKTIRSASDRVAELNAKIAQIEAREQRKAQRQNPVWKNTVVAIKALNAAIVDATDEAQRTALTNARLQLGQVVPLEAVRTRAPKEAEPAKGPRALKPRVKKQAAAN